MQGFYMASRWKVGRAWKAVVPGQGGQGRQEQAGWGGRCGRAELSTQSGFFSGAFLGGESRGA